jgi:hypothetical protein
MKLLNWALIWSVESKSAAFEGIVKGVECVSRLRKFQLQTLTDCVGCGWILGGVTFGVENWALCVAVSGYNTGKYCHLILTYNPNPYNFRLPKRV